MQSLYRPFSWCSINALPLTSLIRPGPLGLLKWDFSRAGTALMFVTWSKIQLWQTLRIAGLCHLWRKGEIGLATVESLGEATEVGWR